jgi:hypothetical protein
MARLRFADDGHLAPKRVVPKDLSGPLCNLRPRPLAAASVLKNRSPHQTPPAGLGALSHPPRAALAGFGARLPPRLIQHGGGRKRPRTEVAQRATENVQNCWNTRLRCDRTKVSAYGACPGHPRLADAMTAWRPTTNVLCSYDRHGRACPGHPRLAGAMGTFTLAAARRAISRSCAIRGFIQNSAEVPNRSRRDRARPGGNP